ncbi:MAG: glutamine amidotransferase [Candidatus Thiodiazotropha sp. L084R]
MQAQSSTTSVAVIRHLAFENLGLFAEVLRARGYNVKTYDAGIDDLAAPIQSSDLVIVLGGPIGVYEQDRYPFLALEKEALSLRISLDRPTLGICLGAQLIAAAAGAKVYSGKIKEIGWGKLKITEAGMNSCLATLLEIPVLHWHGDTFNLPDGATLLAGNEHYPHQAFSLGTNILGLQFHPEVDISHIEQWLIGHCFEMNAAGIDPVALRHRSHVIQELVEPAARRLLETWLGQLSEQHFPETHINSHSA